MQSVTRGRRSRVVRLRTEGIEQGPARGPTGPRFIAARNTSTAQTSQAPWGRMGRGLPRRRRVSRGGSRDEACLSLLRAGAVLRGPLSPLAEWGAPSALTEVIWVVGLLSRRPWRAPLLRAGCAHLASTGPVAKTEPPSATVGPGGLGKTLTSWGLGFRKTARRTSTRHGTHGSARVFPAEHTPESFVHPFIHSLKKYLPPCL